MLPDRVSNWSGNILSFLLPLFSRRAVVSYWRKYVHEVLVNRLGGLSLPRKSVVRLTDRPIVAHSTHVHCTPYNGILSVTWQPFIQISHTLLSDLHLTVFKIFVPF